MRIIFSRKGFDTGSGGGASPIADGVPVSLPIPTSSRSATTYGDLGLGDLVTAATRGRLGPESICHEDPMFCNGRWAFGQTGSAQSHLANQGVGVRDVFLFFGLFETHRGVDRHHRIFGYLQVEKILRLGAEPSEEDQPEGFPRQHPHTVGRWERNNTVYVGPGARAKGAPPSLRLSKIGGPVSRWTIPDWLRTAGLSYHGNFDRWRSLGELSVVARGQEFVTDIGDLEEPRAWLANIIREINDPQAASELPEAKLDRTTSKRRTQTPKKSNPLPRTPSATMPTRSPPIILVLLRQPRSDAAERRDDPFWEFGSFGCTGCHRKNLMNPKRTDELEGARLAFVQGGPIGFRLVHVTPPISVTTLNPKVAEATWSPADMPLTYATAPTVIDASGHSDFPMLAGQLEGVRRKTPVARFASKFRSRRTPLSQDLGAEVLTVYETFRTSAHISISYTDALPYAPPVVEQDRAERYAIRRTQATAQPD